MKRYNKITTFWFVGALIYLHLCYEMFPQANIIYILIIPFITFLIIAIKTDGLSSYLKDNEKFSLFVIAIAGSALAAAALPIFYFIIETIILILIGIFN